MKTMNALRDWWRGYSDEDMAYVIHQDSIKRKVGEMWPMSPKQHKAWLAMTRERLARWGI